MAILVIHNSKEDAELINMFLSRVGSSILLRFSSELPSLPFEGSEEPNLLIFQEREGEVSTLSFIDQVRNYYSSLPIIIISQYGGEWYSPSWPKGDFEDYLSKERLWQLPQAVLRQLHFSKVKSELELQSLQILEKEKRLSILLDHIVEMVSMHDLQGNFTFVSPSSRHLIGYEPDELLGLSGYQWIHPEDIMIVQEKHLEVVRDKVRVDFTFRIICKDGRFLWVESTGNPILNSQTKEVEEIVITTRDINERVIQEARLRKNESLYRDAQQMAKMGNWNLDLEKGEFHVSEGLVEIYGLSKVTMLGFDSYLASIHPQDRPRIEVELGEAMKSGESKVLNFTIVRPDNTERKINTQIRVKLDKDGRSRRVYGIVQDVSELMEVQFRLDNTLNDFEARIEERTSELSLSNQRLTTEVIQKTHFSNRLQAINRDITDSIHYAERIQQSLMPNQGDLLKAFPGSFVLSCPKDIVSGDFYWFHKTSKVAMIAAADCTGHGIPGAFMSVLGITLLNKIVSTGEWERPDVIIELLDLEINNSLGMGRKEHLHDGMDIALCVLDSSKQKLQFVGAMSTIVHVTQQGIAQVYRGNRFGLGGYMRMDIKKFEIQEFTYSPGDMVYFFSDGYIDQFGGVLGKKFYFKNLLSLFKSIYSMEGESQKRRLLSEFMQWKGDCDQTDDVHVMGIRL